MLDVKALSRIFAGFSKKERLIFMVACGAIGLALLDRLVVSPIVSQIDSLETQIKQKEESTRRNLHIVSQKERIQSEVRTYASYFSESTQEEENMTSFLKEVESLANKSSLSIVDMKPAGTKEDKNKVKKILIAISCEGQMEQIMDFMYNVENARSFLTVERYQVGPKSKESSVAVCTMTIAKTLM